MIGEGLSRAERETVIRISEDELTWDIYTSSPVMARKLAKIAASHGASPFEVSGGRAVRYRLPRNAISLRNRRIVTDEWREQATHRLRELRTAKRECE